METNSWEGIEGLEVTDGVARAFAEDGITVPTQIQRVAVGPILSGRNVVIKSGTGTGKTLAYLLPVLQLLHEQPGARAVVVAPSPELAMQILRVVERYKSDTINAGALVATVSHRQQRGRIQKSTRLIVGTPGRVLEMYAQRKLKGVTIMVLDEPDPILGGKDAPFLREVMTRPEPRLQIMVVGATIGLKTDRLVREVLGPNVVWARADDRPLHGQIAHHMAPVYDDDAKDVLVARFIEKHSCRRAIIFVNRSSLIGHLHNYLDEHRLKPVSVGSDLPKQVNKKALLAFASGEARLLITTDRTARGLDVPDVEWILHYEFPRSAHAYVHRAGRTGRAGRRGRSVVFCLPEERQFLKRYAKELGLEFVKLDSG